MPSKAEIIKDLDWITGRISDRIWTISVGVLAFCLTFIFDSIGSEAFFLDPSKVVAPMVLALLALLSDLVQYLAANKMALSLLDGLEAMAQTEGNYNKNSRADKVRRAAYGAKIIFRIFSALWLILVVALRTVQVIGEA